MRSRTQVQELSIIDTVTTGRDVQAGLHEIFATDYISERWPLIAQLITAIRASQPTIWHTGTPVAPLRAGELHASVNQVHQSRMLVPAVDPADLTQIQSELNVWVGGGAVVGLESDGTITETVLIYQGEVFDEYEGVNLLGMAIIKAMLRLQMSALGFADNLSVNSVATHVRRQLAAAGDPDPRAYVGAALLNPFGRASGAVGVSACEANVALRNAYLPGDTNLAQWERRPRVDFLAGLFDEQFARLLAFNLGGNPHSLFPEPDILGQMRNLH